MENTSDLSSRFAEYLISFIEIAERTKSIQVCQRIKIIALIFLELINEAEKWEKRSKNDESGGVEGLLSAIQLSSMLLEESLSNIKSEELRDRVQGSLINLRNIVNKAEE
jgi:2-iminoacetate synthase ThiH